MFFFFLSSQNNVAQAPLQLNLLRVRKPYYFHEGAMYPARAHLEMHQYYCRRLPDELTNTTTPQNAILLLLNRLQSHNILGYSGCSIQVLRL